MCIILFSVCVCMCLCVCVCFHICSHSKRHTHAHTFPTSVTCHSTRPGRYSGPCGQKIDSSRQARPLSLAAASSHWDSSPNDFLKLHKYGSCGHAFMPLHIWCPPPECFPFGLTPLPVFRFSSSMTTRKAPLVQPLFPI